MSSPCPSNLGPRPVHIFVNGIRTPVEGRAWTDRAVSWCLQRDVLADRYEYWSLAVTRWMHQWYRARQVAALVDAYRGLPVTLVGHSNGADVCAKAVRLSRRPVERLVLIAAACEEDFGPRGNGLNDLLANGKVGRVEVWWGDADRTLEAARLWTGWMRGTPLGFLGYGWLGLVGPQHVSPLVTDRVQSVRFDRFDHSTWFDDDEFDDTMRRIVAA